MQLVALDENKKLILAHASESKKDYLCPHCKKKLRLKKGLKKTAHFFHLRRSDCLLDGKSLTHLEIQRKLKDFFKSSELEKSFNSVGRIADVCVEKDKLIFEVQCSNISQEEIERRNRDYQSLGYQVIWIFHLKLFKKHNTSFPFYFTDIDDTGKGSFFDFFKQQWFTVDLSKKFMTIETVQLFETILKNTHYFYGDRLFHFLNGSLDFEPKSKFQNFFRLLLLKRLQKSLDM